MAEPFIGQVDLYGFQFVPENWMDCAGQVLQISSNQALFALLSTQYGGDGRTTFALPDLRGKLAQSFGQHPGSAKDWQVGQAFGSETHIMTTNDLPQHNHIASYSASGGGGGVEMSVSADAATADIPVNASYVASPTTDFIYRADGGIHLVNLGGVSGGGISGGSVTVNATGSSSQFNLLQPTLGMNYCIALRGLFPSHN
jgi:microcystin-dependent protein